MYFLYIIHSCSVDKYYVGVTQNLSDRINKHNHHKYQGSYTKIANDWKYVLTFKTETKKDAVYLEAFIKRMKSRKFIEKIISNENILRDILDKK